MMQQRLATALQGHAQITLSFHELAVVQEELLQLSLEAGILRVLLLGQLGILEDPQHHTIAGDAIPGCCLLC